MCLDSCKRPLSLCIMGSRLREVRLYHILVSENTVVPPKKNHTFRYSLLLLLAPPKIILPDPDPVVRAFAGADLWISVTGTPPISITLKNDTAVLEHGTKDIRHRLTNEGNYSCIAVNDYGNITSVNFSIVFIGAYFLYHM